MATRKVSSILIALVALAHGAGALEAGNKPVTTACFAWLLISSGLASPADPDQPAATVPAKVEQTLYRNGTGPAPAPRVDPEAAPTAQRAAAPDSVTRAFAAALAKYQETTYPAQSLSNPDGSPIRAGQEIPPLEEAGDSTPKAMADQFRKAQWITTLERVSALDRAVMDGLSEVLRASAGKRLPSLEKRMEAIKARGLELEAELRKAALDFYRARAAFKASYPDQDFRSALQENPLQDPPDGQDPRDPEFALQLESLRFHSQRVDFMGKALHRYLGAFQAATAELMPERKPFPDEDERSAGKNPTRPQAQVAKAARATAGRQKATKGKGQVFATRGRHHQDAPADGRFSRRDEL